MVKHADMCICMTSRGQCLLRRAGWSLLESPNHTPNLKPHWGTGGTLSPAAAILLPSCPIPSPPQLTTLSGGRVEAQRLH